MNSLCRSFLVLLGTVSVVVLTIPHILGAEPPPGFKAIFNGRDLSGWEGSPQYWKVADGCLTGTVDGTLKYNRFIIWRGGTLKNFELRAQVKVSPGGNSGINYRSTSRPDLGEWVVTGYQCDVVANRADYNGMLYEERGRRILAHTGEKVIIDPKGQPWVVGALPLKEFPAGQWHEYRIVAEGNRHRHWIAGHPTVEVIDLDPKGRKLEGILAVQVHVGPAMTIQYKDIFLKHLPDDLPILTGRVPFDGESAGEILMKHLTSPPDLRKVPAPFVPILDKALAKNPARRYSSMAEMAREVAATAAPLPQLKEQPAAVPVVLIPAPVAPGASKPPLTMRRQVGELCGSLIMAAFLAALLSLVWTATARSKEAAFAVQCFLLTVASTWAVLIPAKFWPKRSEDSWSRRAVLLGLGLAIGLEAMWLAGHPLPIINWPQALAAEPANGGDAKRLAPHPWFDRLYPDNQALPLAAAFLSYFGLIFLLVPWWKLAERNRPKRFRFGPLLLAVFWAYVFLFLLPTGREREAAATALVMASAIVQLVSPWERPQPVRNRPMRLRYA